ncbi:proteinral transcription repressor [Apophysomyces ossiformis]|uniref:Proteinral transcription repressor n=1 Tax=Apophysomyces ossiformis TaxID=679940 RepID=A0A8H7EQH6_9FUNG|nr:proteinral transcription repressor [Apophysomyces ossiformis]
MSAYNHRSAHPLGHNRLLQILDTLRIEFDQLKQETVVSRSQRDDYENKVNGQIQEIKMLQQHLVELERTQKVIQKQYEDEIAHLRMQIEQVSKVPGGRKRKLSNTYSPPPAPPPTMRDHASYPPALQPAAMPTHAIVAQPVSAPPPNGPMPSLADIDMDTVPADKKIEGQRWFAVFSPKVPRLLNVDLVHTFEHDSVVCCVTFSPDGQYFATGCNRMAYIYDTTTASLVAALQDSAAQADGDLYIRSVSFSPDGKYLATGAEDRQIRIWDIGKKCIRRVMDGHEKDIYSLEFSSDGHTLVSGSGDHSVAVWDWTNGRCIHKLQIRSEDNQDAGVTSIAVSPNGRFVAAGSLDKMIRVWDVASGRLLETLEGHEDSVYSVAFMPDGNSLVSGSLDDTLRLWRLGGGNACTRIFTGHKDFVLSVVPTPDNRWIISGSKDRSIQFWDPYTGHAQFMLTAHRNSGTSLKKNESFSFMF